MTNAQGLGTVAAIMAGCGSLSDRTLINSDAFAKADERQEIMVDVSFSNDILFSNGGYGMWPGKIKIQWRTFCHRFKPSILI